MMFPWFFSAFYSPGNKITPYSLVTVQSNVAGGLQPCGAAQQTTLCSAPKHPLAFFLRPCYTLVK